MRVTFDPNKNARNIAERSLAFERVADLDWETAGDGRGRQKKLRRTATSGDGARQGPRLHVAVITFRGDTMHVISFRKANSREIKRYADEEIRRGLSAR